MTGSPYGVTPGGSWQPPAGPPPFAPLPAQRQSRALTIAALVIACIAMLIAAGSWFRPSDADKAPAADANPTYTAEEESDAVTAVCDARALINEAGSVAGNKTSDDPEMRFVVAINSRLAGTAAADYLQFVYTQNPAIPESLVQPLTQLISAHAQITLRTLTDADRSSLQPLFDQLDEADAAVGQECD